MALPVSRLVRASFNLSPISASPRSFGILLIAGDSAIINGLERVRTYATIDEVIADFGTSAPEYLSASLYFGQTPKPATLMIGRWLRVATAGFNLGGVLSTAEQAMSAWTSVTAGSFDIHIDGTLRALTTLDFSGQTTLPGVASVISTAMSSWGVCTWNGSQFVVTSLTTGILSSVGYATAHGSGTDISAQLKLTSGLAQSIVPGYAAESPVECATALATISTAWYGLTFAASTMPTDDQSIAVAAYIEAASPSRIFGISSHDANAIVSGATSDIGYRLKALNYLRTCVQYSTSSVYAISSFIGRAFSVNFNANKSTITLMYKQEPGVTGETLTTSQANVLQTKRYNVFVNYVNDTKIIQYGTMSGSAWFDEIHGLDWLIDAIQTSCYNEMYTSPTKIPQTDAGQNRFSTVISQVCDQGISNGLIGPGTWNSDSFGQLQTGDYLKNGYYIYAQPIALQAQSDRDLRKAPPIQIAVKLAGATQELDILVDVNR
jgi:hypothetical protein